jgi:hypothetical protein
MAAPEKSEMVKTAKYKRPRVWAIRLDMACLLKKDGDKKEEWYDRMGEGGMVKGS